MWTEKIIASLKGFCQQRNYRVEVFGERVVKIDAELEYYYTNSYTPNSLIATTPEDWKVFLVLENWWEK